jgi:hypothetical protein
MEKIKTDEEYYFWDVMPCGPAVDHSSFRGI